MREFFHKWFDTGKSVFVLTVIPLVFTMLFSMVFSLTYVEKIPLAVLDLDGSAASRAIVQDFENSAGFTVSMYANNETEMKEAFLKGEIKAGTILPENFENDIRAGRSPRALIMIDGSNVFIGNSAYSYAAGILGARGAFGERVLYVPQMGNFVYAFAGYLGIFIQQTFMSVLSPVLLRERRVSAIAKDWIIFSLLTVVAMVACLLVANALGGYPLRGSIFNALIVHIVFILDITAITILISVFFKDTCRCVQFVMLLSIPTFMTSGYIWPEFAMPAGFAALVKAIWPLHYFALPLRDIMLKGAGFWEVTRYIAGGLIYAAFWFPVGLLAVKRKWRRQTL